MSAGTAGPEPYEVYFTIDQDGWTGAHQLSIGDNDGGFRVAGPKYNGSSKRLKKAVVDKRAADEIRAYLDKAFPPAAARPEHSAECTATGTGPCVACSAALADLALEPEVAP